MVYAVGFGLLLAGYTLVDWGQYAMRGKRVSMWYLISGINRASNPKPPPSVGGVEMRTPTPRPSRQ